MNDFDTVQYSIRAVSIERHGRRVTACSDNSMSVFSIFGGTRDQATLSAHRLRDAPDERIVNKSTERLACGFEIYDLNVFAAPIC